MAGKQTPEAQSDILSQIISDDEDLAQLGDNNEPDIDDNDDGDDATGDVGNNDDLDNDDREQSRDKKADVDEDLKLSYKSDKKGNLIDDKGRIVAGAGKERGIFEKLKKKLGDREQDVTKLAGQLSQVATATRELMSKYKALQEKKTYGEKLGLEEREEREAIELFARFKTDPKAALKTVLTKMHLAGQDLSDLGVAGPLDPAEVAKHVLELQKAEEAKKAPPATASVAQQDDQPGMREAKAFLNEHPEILKYPQEVLDAVVQAKQRFPEKSLEEIWNKIHSHIKAQRNQKSQQRRQERRPERPIPHNQTSGDRRPKKKGLDLSARDTSKSFSDIGKELLAELKTLEES